MRLPDKKPLQAKLHEFNEPPWSQAAQPALEPPNPESDKPPGQRKRKQTRKETPDRPF
jgi:hypothetical protein